MTKTMRALLDNEDWDFSATWSKPRPKFNPFHADFPFTTITEKENNKKKK